MATLLRIGWIALFVAFLVSCGTEPPTAQEQQKLQENLDSARAAWEGDPDNIEKIVWLGRRTAYLGRYREAIRIYSAGLTAFPDTAELLRHRGHRHISVRELDKAIEDLEKASRAIEGLPDEVEPDGIPNARNQPTSTLHTNIWYHLGLVYYLEGDFENALRCYVACMEASKNDDMKVATAHWMYMTLRRMGAEEKASRVLEGIAPEMDIIENGSYHDLLLMYKGLKPVEEIYSENEDELGPATVGYGVGNWYFYNGDTERAKQVLESVLSGEQWAAFGCIAAEADVARMRR
jgi:tetratricopeptide (TPR) repeat protein